MDVSTRDSLCNLFDAASASVAEYRAIVRKLVAHLSLSNEEAEIMAWDADGRNPTDRDRLATRAWDFDEVGEAASRRRLFAGFVTNNEPTDGYGADYLIDFALGSGIAIDDVCGAMATLRSASL